VELIDSPDPPQRSQVRSFWNRLTASLSSSSELGLHPRSVDDGLLNNLLVPLQGFVKLVDPDRVLVLRLPVNERNAVGRLLDDELLLSFHLELKLTVEGYPGCSARVFRKSDRNLGVGRKNDWSESKRVRTNGRQADYLSLRVGNRSSTRHVVGSASSRCSEHNSISLDYSPEYVVYVDIKPTHELSTSSGDSDLV